MKKQLLIAAIAVFSSTTVLADGLFGSTDSSNDGSGGFYVGGSVGKTSVDCTGSASGCDDTSGKLFAGYDLTPDLAVEGGYYNMIGTQTAKLTGIGASAVYSMPVADKIEAFGKGGAMMWEGGSSDGTDLLLGAGASYKMDDNWALRGEYEHVGGELKAGMYSVGATFSSF
jgi:opacity protein-like surface antigen